jgi:predicted SprT family Zn-dependent metalloprotease
MEAAFGQDFSNVRVHHGHEATIAGAQSFTRGNDIHFAPGLYNPHSPQGQQLLGHELTHVVQQRQGAGPLAKGLVQL